MVGRIVTIGELVAFLLSLRGAVFATVTAATRVKMNKSGLAPITPADVEAASAALKAGLPVPEPVKVKNPYGEILKWNVINCQLNFHYDAAVIRQLEREGKSEDDFRKGESWHEPYLVDGKLTPFACHKGEAVPAYLRVRRLGTIGETEYYCDGKPIAKEAFEHFLPKSKHYENQGVEKPIEFLVYALEGIRKIVVSGETFEVA